jgi:sulfur carrier protein
MTITLNGENKDVAAKTVGELLRELDSPEIGIAVARNGEVVRRAQVESTFLLENDDIEIIRAVQGG